MTAAVALIGLGEVGRVAVEDLTALGIKTLRAWDEAFADPNSRASRNAAELPVFAADSAEAVAGVDLVICAVTAANDLDAATSAAPFLSPGTWFVDLNSSSPGQKRQAATVIEAVGGRYVEAALMSAIHPRRLGAPFLLGGPHALAFAEAARQYGLTGATFYADEVGLAAATKLCRSIIVKGLEALFTESMLAARAHGVEQQVLGSLSNILPDADWEQVARYFISRSLEHGQRRSEEMLEAADTVAQAGVDPVMARATATRQAWAAGHVDALAAQTLPGILDALSNRLGPVFADPNPATSNPATSNPATSNPATSNPTGTDVS